jgi:hypothetical protein
MTTELGTAAEVYDQWAEWLVKGTDAPWNWKPSTMPPVEVLRRMPAIMFDYDNRRKDNGAIVHEDVTVDDYRCDLCLEWNVTL